MSDAIFTEPAPVILTVPKDDAFARPVTPHGKVSHSETRVLATLKRQHRFLENYSRYGIKGKAAAAAGVTRQSVLRWEEDEAFAQLMRLAFEDSKDAILESMAARGMDGYDQPVYHQGKRVDVYKRYSDAMLLALARARMPQIFGEKATTHVNVNQSTTNAFVVPLERLTDEQFRLLEQIAAIAGPVGDEPKDGQKVIEGHCEG